MSCVNVGICAWHRTTGDGFDRRRPGFYRGPERGAAEGVEDGGEGIRRAASAGGDQRLLQLQLRTGEKNDFTTAHSTGHLGFLRASIVDWIRIPISQRIA